MAYRHVLAASIVALVSPILVVGAQPAPTVDADGSVHVPAFTLPFSAFASPEAKAALIARMNDHSLSGLGGMSIAEQRRMVDEHLVLPLVAKQKARFAVDLADDTIGGVPVQVFTPEAGIKPINKNRVLIDLHGGGFLSGARTVSQLESIPIAALGRIRVVSVDYRQGPEYKFPAASEDVATVYRELLKTYRPANIAIYGCSAGGWLAAQAEARFQKTGLPNPAALGVFCASTYGFYPGDSAYIAPNTGDIMTFPPAPDSVKRKYYFGDADFNDPLVQPSKSTAVLAKFPPTLLLTGTRSSEMGAAARTHLDLTKAGVDARLYVWDGMQHGFFGDPDLPESREAYDIIIKFFAEQMDKAALKRTQ